MLIANLLFAIVAVQTLPALHLIAIFNTVPSLRFSHCAYTGKVLRFAKMMKPYAWRVTEYHNGDSESEADEHVQLFSEEEFHALRGERDDDAFVNDDAVVGTRLHQAFERKLVDEIRRRLRPGDFILHP